MVKRFIGAVFLVFFVQSAFSQGGESGFFIESGGTYLNTKKNNFKSLAIVYDDNSDDVGFYATDWKIRNQNCVGAFMNMQVYEGFYIGFQMLFRNMDLEFSGYTNYTGAYYTDKYGTYDQFNLQHGGIISQAEYQGFMDSVYQLNQYPFKVVTNRFEYSLIGFNLGYRFNYFKTWRPYFQLSPIAISTNITNTKYTDIKHPGYKIPPKIHDYLTLDGSNWCLKSTFGIEYRRFKLYGSVQTPFNEEVLLLNEEKSLPYSWLMSYNLGFAMRFESSVKKPINTYYKKPEEITSKVKKISLNHRYPHYFEIGVSGAIIPLSGTDIQENGFMLFSMDTVVEQYQSKTRNRVHLNYAQFTYLNREIGVPAIGIYTTLKMKGIGVQFEGFYRPVKFIILPGQGQMDMVQSISVSSIYTADQSTFLYDGSSNRQTFELNYHSFPVRLNLLLGKENGVKFVFGISDNFFLASSKIIQNVNTNSMNIYSDFNKLLQGKEAEENLAGNYLAESSDDGLMITEDAFYEYFKNPEKYFESFSTSSFRDKNPVSSTIGWQFGLSYTDRRITGRIMCDILTKWKGRTFFDKGSMMEISVGYMLFGK